MSAARGKTTTLLTRKESGMTIRLCAVVLAVALVAPGPARAGIENAGTTAANFLVLGTNARTLGMAGATLGLGNDLGAASWNAAALGWLGAPSLVLSHAGLENSTLQEWAAVGGRMGNSSTRWALTGLYQGSGGFEGRDASGNATGDFSVSSMAFGGMLARAFGEHVTVGFGSKFVSENLGTASGWGVTFDGGVLVRSGRIGVGLAAQNLGGQMRYADGRYRFPGNIGGGIAYSDPGSGLRLALDANFPSAYYRDVRLGAEWMWRDMLALRAGYRSELGSASDALTGPTFGVGGGHNGMWMDYGYLLSNWGEGQHRLAVRFDLGRFGDPFGQREMPDAFDRVKDDPARRYDPGLIGPPVPKSKTKR
jgi:hypothetical protein